MWTEFRQNIIFLSDMHIVGDNPICRTDNLVQEQISKLDFIVNFANENDAIILSSGDQTDTPRNFISLYILSEGLKNLKTEFLCCFGQHDKYMRTNNPNSISLIIKLGLAKKLSSEPYQINGINIYGCDFGEDPIEPKTKNNILVVHDSITTKELAIKHVDFKDAIEYLQVNSKYDIIICGDIHRRFKVQDSNRIIVNSGPMVRKDASEYFINYSPGFYFLNEGKMRFVKIPHNKDCISRDHIELNKDIRNEVLSFDISSGDSNIDNIILGKIKNDPMESTLKEIIFG